MSEIIRRKVARGAASGGEGGPGADHGWRLAFARACRDGVGLLVEVTGLRLARRGLAELLELPPERAMIALLDGPAGGLGMIALSPDLLAALIEMQTIGKVAAQAPAQRRPTRTDAAMVTGILDRALIELEAILAEEADLEWAGGFRYASFLEDPRPLGLLLEDQPYRVLLADLALGEGGRKGQVILALPAEGKGARPVPRRAGRAPQRETGAGFAAALGEAVMAADCVLDSVIARLTLPLCEVMALEPGQTLTLTGAALEKITLVGIDGRPLALARLGQHRGMRALRLAEIEAGRAAAGGAGTTSPDAGAPATLASAGFDQSFDQGFDPGAMELGQALALDGDGADAGFPAPLDMTQGFLATG